MTLKINIPKFVGHSSVIGGRELYATKYIHQKRGKFEINNLISHHKILEKKEQHKLKASQRKEIIMIRAEINELKTKITENINATELVL